MALDHASDIDGYVAFAEKADRDAFVKANGDSATLHFSRVDEGGEEDDDEDAIPDGYLRAAKAAGAHDEYIAFVAEYPHSPIADGLRRAISMDVLDNFDDFASSFEWALFDRGARAASNADVKNAERMRSLFDEGRLPEAIRR